MERFARLLQDRRTRIEQRITAALQPIGVGAGEETNTPGPAIDVREWISALEEALAFQKMPGTHDAAHRLGVREAERFFRRDLPASLFMNASEQTRRACLDLASDGGPSSSEDGVMPGIWAFFSRLKTSFFEESQRLWAEDAGAGTPPAAQDAAPQGEALEPGGSEFHLDAELMHAALQSAANAVVITDGKGTIRWVNDAFARLTRYSKEEVIGQNPRILKSGLQDNALYLDLWETISKGKVWKGELVNRRKDGTLYTEEMTITPVRDGAGTVDHFIAVKEDISKRKATEGSLRRQIALDQALAQLADAVLNHATVEELSDLAVGFGRELTGSRFGFAGYLDPSSGHLVACTMTRDVWDQCQIPDKSVVLKKFGGLWGWVLVHRQSMMVNHPSDDPRSTGAPQGHIPIERFLSAPALMDGTLMGQIALANADRDYTDEDLRAVERIAAFYAIAIERIRNEEALKAGQEKYRKLAEGTDDIIFQVDHLGNILYIAPQISRFGYHPSQVMGHNMVEFIHPNDRERVVHGLGEMLEMKKAILLEFRILTANGDEVWVEENGQVMCDQDGKAVGITGIIRDITERKRNEKQIKEHLEELRRWQDVMLDREDRIQELKREVNALSCSQGKPKPYPSQEFSPDSVMSVS